MRIDESLTAADGKTRREFLKKTINATVAGAAAALLEGCAVSPRKPRLLVSKESVHLAVRDQRALFEIKSILDHEMVVV
jgi:hypothetical protein